MGRTSVADDEWPDESPHSPLRALSLSMTVAPDKDLDAAGGERIVSVRIEVPEGSG